MGKNIFIQETTYRIYAVCILYVQIEKLYVKMDNLILEFLNKMIS